MTDAEMARYLDIDEALVHRLTGSQRAAYEHMAKVESELLAWQAGMGPKPAGVIVTYERKRRRKP